MHHYSHTALCKSLVKGLALTGFMVFILACSSVNAQRRNDAYLTYGGGSNGGGSGLWGIVFTAGYDVPVGNFATTFKAAPAFAIGVNRNYGDFTFNTTIGYISYKPKLDTFFYNGTDNTAGYIKYENLSSIQVYLGVAYNIAIADEAKFYFGVDLGTYYNHFAYDSNDGEGGIDEADTEDEVSYVAPKLGINFMVSDDISIGIEGKYNFQLSSSSGSGDAYDYGYATTVNKSFSGNFVLTYNF